MNGNTTLYNGNREYHLLNVLVFLVIAIMFILVKFGFVHVRCVYAEIGEACKTCGLTRAMSAALNGDLSGASMLHRYILFMFGSQLLLRPLVSLLLLKNASTALVARTDIMLTIALLIPYLYLIIN